MSLRPVRATSGTCYLSRSFRTSLPDPSSGPATSCRSSSGPRPHSRCGGEALFAIAVGLVKKLVISDQLAKNLVDRVFERPTSFSALEVLCGVYGYAVQIYCDFSGYTDIAVGSALLLGIRFPKNFDAPYLATNIADFWRRWHISLSTWLRDYLYIPLGGSRGAPAATYRN